MIKKEDLLDAIAECQGERNPNANTCIKLAAFYTILNNMYNDEHEPEEIKVYSNAYEEQSQSEQVRYDSGSEFSDIVYGKDVNDVLSIVDELIDAVSMISPRLYNATIEKLKNM